jgi:probable O-glycosylation ligase (exosortase A-associated)
MGRINAWQFAWNLASDRPIGGGFRAFTPALFLRYAPDPSNYHDAHSIYFQALGEQGFPGIVIYMTLMIASLLRMQRLRALTRGQPQFKWVRDLAEMLQCSIVGYALGGAFLTVAYFDLYYYLVIAGVLLDVVYWDERHRLSQEVEVVPAMAPVLVPMPAPRPA